MEQNQFQKVADEYLFRNLSDARSQIKFENLISGWVDVDAMRMDKNELLNLVQAARLTVHQLKNIHAPMDQQLRARYLLADFSYRLQHIYDREFLGETSKHMRSIPFAPPRSGERILLLLLSKQERVNIPGDLAEEFIEIAKRHGGRFAKIWYWRQVVTSAGPLLHKLIRWGLFAWVEEWLRRHI